MDMESDVQKLLSFLSGLNESRSSDSHSVITTSPPSIPSQDTICARSNDSEEFEKCLESNMNYIGVLNNLESMLQTLLEKCIREQRIVNSQIEVRSRLKNKVFPSAKRIEAHIRKVCQTPYFKDCDGFYLSSNEDTLRRRRCCFLNVCELRKPISWSTRDEEILKNFVREEEKKKWIETLKKCGMLHMTNVEEMSLSDLVESRIVEYDWLKLSVCELRNVHTPHECKALWINCLHPKINQTEWTKKENGELKLLATLYNRQNWEKITIDLQTKRSSFQCIMRYSNQLHKEETRMWSVHEIELLKKTVSKFSFMNYIPWDNIKYFLDGYTLKEIFLEWTKLNSLPKPFTFSLEEDIVLVAGMRMFGNDIFQISQCLPDRSTRQIRERINVLMGRQFPRKRWTESEDKLLCKLVKKYGFGNWLKISLRLVNRDPSSVRKRFITLQENAAKYGSTASCSSVMARSPKTKLDIVNLEMLWETAKNICSEYGLSLNNSCTSELQLNVVQKLSALLKPTMRNKKMIDSSKLKPILENEYYRFFFPTYKLNIYKYWKSYLGQQLVPNEVYDLVNALKILKAEVILPRMYLVQNDSTMSDDDKTILKYILNKESKLLKQDENNSPFCLTRPKNFKSMNCDSVCDARDHSRYVVPLNSDNLLTLRTLCLHYQNLKHQEEGLTLQVDDTELKYARNSICTPLRRTYGKGFSIASELWNERLFQILFWPYLLLNDNLSSAEIFE